MFWLKYKTYLQITIPQFRCIILYMVVKSGHIEICRVIRCKKIAHLSSFLYFTTEHRISHNAKIHMSHSRIYYTILMKVQSTLYMLNPLRLKDWRKFQGTEGTWGWQKWPLFHGFFELIRHQNLLQFDEFLMWFWNLVFFFAGKYF